MAFPTTSLVNNQVHKEGNRAWVYDSTVGVWDQVSDNDTDASNLSGVLGSTLSGVLGSTVTGGSGLEAVPGRYFYVNKNNSSNQTVAADQFTLITWDTGVQSHSSFSLSNEYFTAVAADAGNWFFIIQGSFYVDDGTMQNPLLNFYLNDANIMGGYKFIDNTSNVIRHFTAITQGIINISSGDTVKAKGYCGGTDNGSSPMFLGGDSQSIKGWGWTGVKL